MIQKQSCIKKDNILVSVIIPTYGGRNTLIRAIDSVLSQTYTNIEIIIVDDNDPSSKGRTVTEFNMQKYQDLDSIIYIRHEANGERSQARNTGIEVSKGKYVMFLDDDDEFYPDKVNKQVEFMEKSGKEYSCCYTGYINVDDYGKVIMRCEEKRSGHLFTDALKRNLFVHAGSNLMVRRDVIDEIGRFDIELNACEDVEFLSRLLLNYSIGYVDYVGLIVHIEHSISKNYKLNVEKYIKKIAPLLSTLSDFEKKAVIKRIELQICRYDIGKRDLRSLRSRMKRNGITYFELFRYGLHLCYRKVTKKSYGYNH